MERYLDYKATIWFRIPIDSKEELNKTLSKLEDGMLPSELYNEGNELGQCQLLYDTEEYLDPSKNGGEATIEVFEIQKINNCTQEICIWTNNNYEQLKTK